MNIRVLETTQFYIRHSRSHEVLDVRLREGVSHSTLLKRPLAPISVRLAAEQRLHELYIESSTACRRGRCSVTPISSLYISVRYGNGHWNIVCDPQEKQLGLCGTPPLDYFARQLRLALREASKLHEGGRCIAIHIALSLGNTETHANTLLLDTKTKHAWRFEPLGNFVYGFRSSLLPNLTQLHHIIEISLRDILTIIGYRYKGELSTSSPFQDDNPDLCYLWTTWVEFLAALNPQIPPLKLGKYLDYRYGHSIVKGRSRRQMILLFSHYLQDLLHH